MENYHFFWESDSPFSNWYMCDFTYKGVNFNCSEQAMMWEKAQCSGDIEVSLAVLREDTPRGQKALGRSIKNFNVEKWDSEKYEIVKDVLRHKFSQNKDLMIALLEHRGKIFVEASPYDRIWGIGYSEENALDNIQDWGTNLLGQMLTGLAMEFSV